MRTRLRLPLGRAVLIALLGAALVALPAASAPKEKSGVGSGVLAHLSGAASMHGFLQGQAEQAGALRAELRQRNGVARSEARGAPSAFSRDDTGLPQDEESITACRSNPHVVLGGTNDFRGILDPEGNFTGWHFSTDGGTTVANEGLLPPAEGLASQGDPVDAADAGCNLFAGSLNFNFDPNVNFLTAPNGIGVYRSDPATLASCPGGSDPSCWPTRKIVALAPNTSGTFPSHFFDKEWLDVGVSGSAGQVVWVVFSDFLFTGPGEDTLDFTASIKAVRCNAALTSCGLPILISGSDEDIQFGDVTIGQDERTYISWSEIQGELPGQGGAPSQPQTFIHKLRIAPAGSLVFGPTRIIASEGNAIPFGGKIHSNDFRAATYPKNAVAMVGGQPRIYVTWDACQVRVFDAICEEPEIKLTHSDDDGVTWSTPAIISSGGDNYFPTISADLGGRRLAIAWFTNRFDPAFHARQDIELVAVDAASGQVRRDRRLTRTSNDPEADPIVGGGFIGDYIEVFAHDGKALVHFNANYRQVPLLGEGVPINQQDNFLVSGRLGGADEG